MPRNAPAAASVYRAGCGIPGSTWILKNDVRRGQ